MEKENKNYILIKKEIKKIITSFKLDFVQIEIEFKEDFEQLIKDSNLDLEELKNEFDKRRVNIENVLDNLNQDIDNLNKDLGEIYLPEIIELYETISSLRNQLNEKFDKMKIDLILNYTNQNKWLS